MANLNSWKTKLAELIKIDGWKVTDQGHTMGLFEKKTDAENYIKELKKSHLIWSQ